MELEFAYVGRITQSFGTKSGGLFAATGLFSNMMILIAPRRKEGKTRLFAAEGLFFNHIV